MEKILGLLRQFPFVRNPYSPHSFVRLDAFQKQFTIVCSGVMNVSNKAPGIGYRQTTSEYIVGYCSLIEDAIRLCTSRFYDLYAYPQIETAASFEPRMIEIYYTGAHAYPLGAPPSSISAERVLKGFIGEHEVVWYRPSAVVDEISALAEWMENFHNQVCEQMTSGDVDVARDARREARELNDFFISLKWRPFVLKALNKTGATCSAGPCPAFGGD
ncbi:hypothetical protein ACW9IK_20000 [Pseudomonas gingeri]